MTAKLVCDVCGDQPYYEGVAYSGSRCGHRADVCSDECPGHFRPWQDPKTKPQANPAPPPKNFDACQRCSGGPLECDKLRARAEKAEDDYNGVLAATNEHTVRCFAERDQLRGDFGREQHRANGFQMLAISCQKDADRLKSDLAAAKGRISDLEIALTEEQARRDAANKIVESVAAHRSKVEKSPGITSSGEAFTWTRSQVLAWFDSCLRGDSPEGASK